MESPSYNNQPHKHFSPVSFVAGLVIALIIFFAIYKSVSHHPVAQEGIVVKDSLKPKAAKVESIKKVGLVDFTEEHFYKEHHHRHINQDDEAIVVSPNEMAALEKGNLSEQQKKLLELLPNAPVIYIFDLKITDYQNLYFSMGEPLVLDNKMAAGQLLHDGLKEFSEDNFIACFNKMGVLSLANPSDVNALFYGGMAAYYQKDFTEAEMHFDKVINAKNNVFKQEASWFKALALLENNKKDAAKQALKEIVNTKGFYTNKAFEKLKQIN